MVQTFLHYCVWHGIREDSLLSPTLFIFSPLHRPVPCWFDRPLPLSPCPPLSSHTYLGPRVQGSLGSRTYWAVSSFSACNGLDFIPTPQNLQVEILISSPSEVTVFGVTEVKNRNEIIRVDSNPVWQVSLYEEEIRYAGMHLGKAV